MRACSAGKLLQSVAKSASRFAISPGHLLHWFSGTEPFF